MPEIFATSSRVDLLEWACIRTINSHIDWSPHREKTYGYHTRI
jgi:fluoroacetyl-CoA thioesterase